MNWEELKNEIIKNASLRNSKITVTRPAYPDRSQILPSETNGIEPIATKEYQRIKNKK